MTVSTHTDKLASVVVLSGINDSLPIAHASNEILALIQAKNNLQEALVDLSEMICAAQEHSGSPKP
jgi:hypothetical protein